MLCICAKYDDLFGAQVHIEAYTDDYTYHGDGDWTLGEIEIEDVEINGKWYDDYSEDVRKGFVAVVIYWCQQNGDIVAYDMEQDYHDNQNHEQGE